MQTHPPLTLRDYFAGQAMQSVIINNKLMKVCAEKTYPEEAVAHMSYDLADGMMNERKRRADEDYRKSKIDAELGKKRTEGDTR